LGGLAANQACERVRALGARVESVSSSLSVNSARSRPHWSSMCCGALAIFWPSSPLALRGAQLCCRSWVAGWGREKPC
jgi:hypothetical protein